MSKLQGHLVISIFDIAAVGLLYWLYVSHIELVQALEQQLDIVSFNNRTYILAGAILIPMLHIMAIFEAVKPSFFTKSIKKLLNYVILSVLAIFLIAPFIISHKIESKLIANGYQYCDEASFHGTVSSTRVFVKKLSLCTKDLELW